MQSLFSRLPKEQVERVFNQPCCDINYEFLGFMDVYHSLSKIIPKHFTIVDLGCAYNAQCFYFTEHKRYIAVDYSNIEKFKSDNCDIYVKNINDFILEDTNDLDLESTFAICSYVPIERNLDKKAITDKFPNIFIYYPSLNKETVYFHSSKSFCVCLLEKE